MTVDQKPIVLILGANGRLGSALVAAFANAGWTVLAQARRAPATLPAGARYVTEDLSDTHALADTAAGASVVVFAVNLPYSEWHTQALPLARLGMDLAQRLGALFMLPGNVYNYGADMPAVLEPHAPQNPSTRKGRVRTDMELEMQQRASLETPQRLRSVVLRAGDFFGSSTGSWFDLSITRQLAKGKLTYPGLMDQVHAWAYVPDLAAAFVAVAGRADVGDPFYRELHFEGYSLTGEQLLNAVEQAAIAQGLAAGKGFKRGTMPWGVIRLGGLVVPNLREIAEMSYLWNRPHVLDGTALRDAVGDGKNLPSTPLHIALRQALSNLGFGPQPPHSATFSAPAL